MHFFQQECVSVYSSFLEPLKRERENDITEIIPADKG